jgi:hypothetical protein
VRCSSLAKKKRRYRSYEEIKETSGLGAVEIDKVRFLIPLPITNH